jgi:hypothetical protein
VTRTETHGGQYLQRTARGDLREVPPARPDVVVCRRVADFPGGCAPTGAVVAICARCPQPVAYDPAGPHQEAPRICLQCGGITPLPIVVGE